MPRPRRRRRPEARTSACGNVKRTAVCATSGGTPIASEHVRGLVAAGGARRSARRDDAAALELQQDRFAARAREGEARRARQAVHRVAGQARARHGLEHAGDEPVAQRRDAGRCLGPLGFGELERGGEARPRRRRLRCRCGGRAPARRRAAAVRAASRPRTASTPVPFGAPSLCPASEIASAPRSAALSGSQPAACTASTWTGTRMPGARHGGGDRRDILDRADLVVRVADADERGVVSQRGRDIRRIDAARAVDRHARHFEAVHPREVVGRLEDRLVLDRRQDQRRGRASRCRAAAAIAMPLTARLLASVPPDVKMTSLGRMPRTRATRARASASASAAASPTVWWLDGLPNQRVRNGIIASSTSGRTGVVAALSR